MTVRQTCEAQTRSAAMRQRALIIVLLVVALCATNALLVATR